MDDNPALVADVHTNPTNDPRSVLYPPRVLHAATGSVSPIFLIADKGNGPTLYVGPAFSYYEVVETGDSNNPPARLTDYTWQERLQQPTYPTPPDWTNSFRIPAAQPPTYLHLPSEPEL